MLSQVKLIAEPWDLGQGGYQVGNFPVLWTEWNGKYRDTVRRFWRGDGGTVSELATRLVGQQRPLRAQRPPAVREHQLHHRARRLHAARPRQLQRQAQRGERRGQPRRREQQPELELRRRGPDRRPGDRRAARAAEAQLPGDAAALAGRADDQPRRRARPHAARQQQRLLPGQRARPGSTGTSTPTSGRCCEFTRKLVHFRLAQPTLRRRKYFQGRSIRGGGKDVAWLAPDGREMNDEAWNAGFVRSLGMLLSGTAIEEVNERGEPIIGDTLLVLLNGHNDKVPFTLPPLDADQQWQRVFDTFDPHGAGQAFQGRRALSRCRAARSPCSRSDAAAASDARRRRLAAIEAAHGSRDVGRLTSSRQSRAGNRAVDERRPASVDSRQTRSRPPTSDSATDDRRTDCRAAVVIEHVAARDRRRPLPDQAHGRRSVSTSPRTSSPTATTSIAAVLRDRHRRAQTRNRGARARGSQPRRDGGARRR